uniref:non-specific serine/threonine protein kinase n=1 Tax=Salix viminalis TaxID=40686 RepID=A0A6N2K681_SALVM
MRDMNLQNFTYNELETATGGFDEELGRGAFGPVYKGVLGGEDKQIIAVKRLEKMAGEGETEFKTEVTVIGRTNHKNLVQLVGFCNEGQHRLLVYEYMSGGSLSNYIFGDSRPNWHRRLQIAFGVARGLLYLHEECSSQIIHCDIKPQNILLDESFNARISDFGLAKLLKTEQSKTITVIRGTKGYVAPEWFKNLPVTAKVDTYSFGILLLELVCCRKNFEINAREEHQIVLADWACDCFKEGKLNLLVEEDEEAMEDMKRVERFVMVAIWCIQEDPSLRPAMKKVVQMLEGDPSIGDKALMKVSKGNWTAKKRDRSALIVPGSVLLGSSIFLNVLSVLGIYLFFTRWIRQKQIVIPQHHLTPAPDMNLRNFTYNIELETATGGFDEELGRGAFGPVYKGVLGDEDKQMIAVKKIHCYKYVSSKILGMASASFTLMFLATMVLLQLMAVAQTDGSKPVGASITANDDAPSWLSSSGEFAFGFRQMENKDYFLLSIWYEKIPEKTVVWYAMGEDPTDDLAVSRGSKVELTADSGLVLTDPQGNRIWSSGGFLGTVSSGVMNDTGNFVLQDRNSDRLWESFTHPTDTLLPTQIMEAGGIVSSRRTETNFSLGRFQLRFLDNGNLVLNAMNFPTKFAYDAYYTSQTSDDSNSLNSGYRLIFNESGYMYILRRNGLREDLTEGTVPTDFYHRATLNFDGVFTQYFYPKASSGNRSWSSVWSKPDNICVGMGSGLGSGVCGYNSICDLKADKRPECNCPPGFSLLDQNDKYGSCIPDFELGCRSDGLNSTEDQYDFTALINVDWPTSDYERYKPYTEEECRKSCLNDCLCSVAIFRDGCWKKKLPLSNGRLNAGMNGKAFLKFRKGSVPLDRSRLPLPGDKKKPDTKLITGSVVLGTSVFVNFVLVGAFCLTSSFIYRKKTEKTPEGGSCLETNLRYFSYKELAEATNDFKDELGRGGFGIVYKGTIQVGSTKVVAVKKLERVVHDGDKEFKTEVQVIGQTHHKNLARLLGFCDEGQNRLLMENKDYFLLSIWYEKIPEKTVVWYAMGEDPTDDPAVSRGSKVELTADSGLVLTDPQGNRIWSSGGFLGTVSSGVMNDTGNFVLQDRNSDRLWESFTHPTDTLLPTQIVEAGGIVSSRRTETNFSLGRFQLRFLDGNLDLTEGTVPTDFYHRATLNFDGVFTQYFYPKASSEGFLLLDQNDKYGSCIPQFELGCRSDGLNSTEGQYDFTELINVDWPTSDYERYRPYTEEECRKSCLNDCVRPGEKKKPDTKLITGSVVLGTSVFVNFVLVGAFCLTSSVIYRKKTEKPQEGGSCLETNLRYFSYKELAEATNDFKDELGRGGFGVVYKGTIQAGSTKVVAVKKLTRVVQDGEKEFKTEVQVIGQTHHKNLARLLGFCDEGQNRLLVYEFLSNGTLANFLFGSLRPSWKQRTQIAFGIARGLLYLHEECGTQIIHCDIKPQNILLDDYYNARISDFGLAKLLAMDQSKTQTAMRGTKGYISPEWFRNKPITVKVDVYSFGVILLEIICCRRSVDLEMGEAENPVLTDWAYDCYVNGTLDVLIGDDTEAMNDMSTLERLLKVGIWCIQEEPSLRPTMRKVTQMLEGVIEVPAAPNPYPYMNERRVDSERENADDAYDDAYESYERVDADLSGVSAADMGMNAGDNADVTLRGAAGSARGAPGSADGGAHGSTPGSADFHFFILSSIYFTKTMDLNKTSYNKKLTHQTPLHHYTMLVSTYAWLEVFLWYAGGNTIFIYLLFFFFVSNWFFLVF